MKKYNQDNMVIYTDCEGNRFDTFVIYDTDPVTGLTHINHQNLRVPARRLKLRPASAGAGRIPMKDPYSFKLFRRLREKYSLRNKAQKPRTLLLIQKSRYHSTGKRSLNDQLCQGFTCVKFMM
jgi:hypothetical protein